MGRVHAFTLAEPRRRSVLTPVARAIDATVAVVVLTLALPLIAVLAIAVRRSSVGPVLHREPGFDYRGRPVQLLTFRTSVDGAGTVTHERLRAVVGADARHALTPVGRIMRATRLDQLPRLYNVALGHSGILVRR